MTTADALAPSQALANTSALRRSRTASARGERARSRTKSTAVLPSAMRTSCIASSR